MERPESFAVKTLYERYLRENFGKRSPYVPMTPRNTTFLNEIARKCKVCGIQPEHFFSIISTEFEFPYEKNGKQIDKPYLGFLSSDVVFSVVRSKLRRIGNLYRNKDVTMKVVKNRAPGVYDSKFHNAFYGGFPVIKNAVKSLGWQALDLPEDRVALLLAFPEIWSPEFVFTHTAYKQFSEIPRHVMTREAVQLESALKQRLAQTIQIAKADGSYSRRLQDARDRVAKREQGLVERQFGQADDWREMWKLLL